MIPSLLASVRYSTTVVTGSRGGGNPRALISVPFGHTDERDRGRGRSGSGPIDGMTVSRHDISSSYKSDFPLTMSSMVLNEIKII